MVKGQDLTSDGNGNTDVYEQHGRKVMNLLDSEYLAILILGVVTLRRVGACLSDIRQGN